MNREGVCRVLWLARVLMRESDLLMLLPSVVVEVSIVMEQFSVVGLVWQD